MKKLLLILSVWIINSAQAKTYYFSAISGDDSRTSAEAQFLLTPWKTLSKLNSIFNTLLPGDSVLFKRGEEFTGSITITMSGTASLPIVLGAYGIGVKPVISGFTTLTGWVAVGNNIFESYNAALGTAINVVAINGKQQPQGRYPNFNTANKGYLTFESHGTNYIVDNQLTSAITWTGGELVVRTKRWILDRTQITAHSGTKLTFSPALTYDPYNNYGYFIQNHIKTLDQPGEWYYNPSTKKVSVYSMPAGRFEASTVDVLVTISGKSFIVFDNLVFEGSNKKTFDLYYANNIKLLNCDILDSGTDGIYGSSAMGFVFENSTISNTNNNAINLNYNCNNTIIRRSIVRNTGIYPGLGLSNNNTYQAITVNGRNNLFEYNQVDSSGFAAIRFSSGDSNVVKNNLINYFTLTKDDGGGINTGVSSTATYNGIKVIGNIILNGIGIPEGTDRVTSSANGIYMDDNTSNVDITDNTVSNCGNSGIILHNSYNINVRNNTLFNNINQLILVHDLGRPDILPRNYKIKNNIFFAKTAAQTVTNVSTLNNDIKLVGSLDSNYYCRPVDDNLVIKASTVNAGARVDQVLDLKGWQTNYTFDKASIKTPAQVPAYTVSAAGTNKLPNGTFNTSNSGLYSSATSSWNSNKLDGGTFQASNSSATATTYSVIIAAGVIDANKNYVFKFSSQSAKDTIVSIYLRQSAAPYAKLSDVKICQITTGRKENEFLFQLPAACTGASIIFETKCPKITFWLDNLEFYEAQVTVTNPDDYIRFEYNATELPKVVPLLGTYVDSRNNLYAGVITLAPYSSAVLVKRPDLLRPVEADTSKPLKDSLINNYGLTTVKDSSDKKADDLNTQIIKHPGLETLPPGKSNSEKLSLEVLPNPTRSILFVTVKGIKKGDNITLYISSISGNMLKSHNVNTSSQTVPLDVSSLVSGLYILKVVGGNRSAFTQFIKI